MNRDLEKNKVLMTHASTQRPRILIAPTAVAGNSIETHRALLRAGENSTCLIYEDNQYVPSEIKVLFKESDSVLRRELLRLYSVLTNSLKFDVYLFNFGTSLAFPSNFPYLEGSFLRKSICRLHEVWTDLLQLYELSVLRIRRCRIIVIYQGDDARQGDYSLNNYDVSIASITQEYYSSRSDRRKRRHIARLEKFGAKLLALNPDLLDVLPPESSFLPYSHINLGTWTQVAYPKLDGPLVIGHAPSVKSVKGTEKISQAVDRLRDKGIDVELRLFHKIPNNKIRESIASCHVLIDQIYAGFYGGVAVEAMSVGRPVLCFIRHADLRHLPKEMVDDLPIISISASTLEADIEELSLLSEEQLRDLASKSRQYVEKWHDSDSVAKLVSQMWNQDH